MLVFVCFVLFFNVNDPKEMHWKLLPLQYEWVEEQPSLLRKAVPPGCGGRQEDKKHALHSCPHCASLLCPAIWVRAGSFLCPFSLQILSPQVLPPPNISESTALSCSGGVLFHAWGAVDTQLQCSSNSRVQQMLPGELARIDWWGIGERGIWKTGNAGLGQKMQFHLRGLFWSSLV